VEGSSTYIRGFFKADDGKDNKFLIKFSNYKKQESLYYLQLDVNLYFNFTFIIILGNNTVSNKKGANFL
jgi:hypothetical protein